MKQALKVAGIGAGFFSSFHYDAWKRLSNVELVAVCDLNLSAAQVYTDNVFDDLERMLETAKPDILDIILPPAAHAHAIRQALAAGVKTIICQKPFCENFAQAKEITQEAANSSSRLIVHENFRFQPWYRVIKTFIEQGRLGKVRQMTFRFRPGDGQGPDAYLDRQPYFQTMKKFLVHETAIHWIDTFRFLNGEPTHLYADLRQENPAISGEDAGVIILDFPNGCRTIFDGNRLLDHGADNTRCTMGEALIEGDEASLELRGDGSLHLRRFGSVDTQCVLEPTRSTNFGADCVYLFQEHVVAALSGNELVENTAEEYLKNLALEEAVYQSSEIGQKLSI